MSSWNSRRVRSQRRRHAKRVTRLRDRFRTFDEQGRHKEAERTLRELADIIPPPSPKKPVQQAPRRPPVQPWVRVGSARVRSPAPLTSQPVEKMEPKVHGVNSQREDRRKPIVGGARGKK
jgi:hypothetical protein